MNVGNRDKKKIKFSPTKVLTGLLTLALSSTSMAAVTLPAQQIFGVDTLANGKGVIISFDGGEKLEGCNSSNVFIAESPVLDRTLSIALSAFYANQKIQFNVSGCAEGGMNASALSLAKAYSVPGTRFTIASNATTADLAKLIDPNSASIFYITIDHNTTLRGDNGAAGTVGATGAQGVYGVYGVGGNGSAGGRGGNGSTGGWAINLTGFTGKQVIIINNGQVIAGNGGNGGAGGRGGKGGTGKGYSPIRPNCGGNKYSAQGPFNGYPGGSGGAGAQGGLGGGTGIAIINTEGVGLSFTGNAIVAGLDGVNGSTGGRGATGSHGSRGYACRRNP